VTDPYRIFDSPPRPTQHASTRGAAVRPLLWLLLVISAAANVVASTADLVFVGAGFGVVTLVCAAALVVHHYRRRRR
jgi:hypothetical protein